MRTKEEREKDLKEAKQHIERMKSIADKKIKELGVKK